MFFSTKIIRFYQRILFFALLLILGGTSTASAQATGFTAPSLLDLSDKTWEQAFDLLNTKMKQEYAFTNWDDIDWNALATKYRPLIAYAQAHTDEILYYQRLREYLSELHDAHVQIESMDDYAKNIVNSAVNNNIGGSYGLIISQVDGNRYIVSYVMPGGPADLAGVKIGAEVTIWNNQSIQQAINAVSTVWTDELEPGTKASKSYEQLRLLVLGRIGSKVQVIFKNPKSDSINAVTLTAIKDDKILKLSSLYPWRSDPKYQDCSNWVTSTILPSGYGYLKIVFQQYDTSDPKDFITYKKFRFV